MPPVQDPESATSKGPITFADVKLALGESDPARVNARSLRDKIGRGSLSTVQKHLSAIREESRRALVSRSSEAVPEPPDGLVAAVWSAAFVAAQASCLARLESLAAERDLLKSLHESFGRDVNTLADELDAMGAEHRVAAKRMAAAHQTEIEQLQAKLQEVSATALAHDERRAAVVRELQDCKARQELSEGEHQLRCLTLRGEVDRLVEQMARMRSLEIVMAAQVKDVGAE